MNPVDKVALSPDWITLILVLSMTFLALGKYFFQNRFLSFALLLFDNKYVAHYYRKGGWLSRFHIFLTLFQYINLALFLFLCQQHLLGAPLGNTLEGFLVLMCGLFLFHWLKIGMQYLKGFIFNTKDLISALIFYKTSYLNYSGFIMFLGNVMVVYVLKEVKVTLYIVFVLLFLINIIGVARILKNYRNMILPFFLYFILYICLFEVVPLVLLGSYAKD